MKIISTDIESRYSLHVEMAETFGDNVPCVCLELCNIDCQTKTPIPDETCFFMSIQDARELKVWLDCVLDSSPYKSPSL